jgi:hypothetical protein
MEETESFPYWLSGFTDGEGCFSVSFNKKASLKLKLEVRPSFSIGQSGRRVSHQSQIQVLDRIQSYFGCGFIRKYKRTGMLNYEVRSLSDLNDIIIPHFEKYSLLTQKQEDFENLKQVCLMMRANLHRNKQGLEKIIILACKMNPSGTRKILKEELLKLLRYKES